MGTADHRFSRQLDIRFAHCDPAGIVFYPRYFEMINGLVEDWLAELGWSFGYIHGERQEGLPTVNLQCAFHAPARLGDIVDFHLQLLKLGNSSCQIEVLAEKGETVLLNANISLVYVATHTTEIRSRGFPLELRERFAGWLPESERT